MKSEHGITCECGQKFQNPKNLRKHIATKEILEEVKRIGGEKFYRKAKDWEEDAHSGDLQEFAETHNLELTPKNATEIAKEEIVHIVRHNHEYLRQDLGQSPEDDTQ